MNLSSLRCGQQSRGHKRSYTTFKLRLHDTLYRLRFYSNSLIHILSLSNLHSNVASMQKTQDDTSHPVIVIALAKLPVVAVTKVSPELRFIQRLYLVLIWDSNSHHWHLHCKCLSWYQEFLCMVEPLHSPLQRRLIV